MNVKSNYENSITMDLEILQKKYSNVLIKYKQATTDYIDYLKTQPKNSKKQLVQINNASYVGTGSAGDSKSINLTNCRVDCINNSKCSGATFISGSCDLRTGDSQIIPRKNSIAIVPKEKKLLMNIDNLNRQLIIINDQIRNKIKLGTPIYKKLDNENRLKSQELNKQYKELNKERNNIQKLLDNYDELKYNETDNQLRLNQNYYTYILLSIVGAFLIYILFKISYSGSNVVNYGGEIGYNIYYILFILILIIITINFTSKFFII
jgi:hypothetical protein